MITKAHITRRASDDGVPAKTVERDYALAHIVAAISTRAPSHLIFKGGTALRLCHFAEYRYSADLDFSITEDSVDDALASIGEALEHAAGSIVGFRLSDDKPPRIAYVGPLGRERTIKLDLADDEIVFHTEQRSLVPRWSDLPAGAEVRVYTLLEIAAEKLRCVLQRLQCRDLLDLHLLFEDGRVDAKEAAHLFKPKAEHRGIDPASFADRYRDRVPQYAKRWQTELREHVPGDVPHFEEVERKVTRQLRRGGLL